MAKILLDYVFPISVIPTIPEASTGYLKQVCVVAKPKSGQEGNVGTIFECNTMAAVAARTDNANIQQLFDAGMAKVFVLLADSLVIADDLVAGAGDFWTVLIADDFTDEDLATDAVAASKKLQDILYTAKTAGAAGNAITVTYEDGNTGGAASASASGSDITVSIEDGVTTAATIASAIASDTDSNALVSTAVDAGDESDAQAAGTTTLENGADATIATAAVAASVKVQDILYTAKTAGVAGNDIAIIYLDTNTAGAASSSAAGSVITVSIESGVTTAATIATAVGSDTASNALVATAVDVGDESDPQVTQGSTPLVDGAAAILAVSDTIDVGAFDGVVGFASTDVSVCQTFGAAENRCAFFTSDANGAKNMMYAFGKLLSNLLNWTNQQYITMPVDDGVDTLGAAGSLFDDKVSFVIHDTDYGNRLALFTIGGKAVVAPYIGKNLRVDLQGRTLQYIGANQPAYTLTQAALLEQRLQEDIINVRYIQTGWIEAGVIEVKLLDDNFVASGFINIAEPKALWRMFGEMRSTL